MYLLADAAAIAVINMIVAILLCIAIPCIQIYYAVLCKL